MIYLLSFKIEDIKHIVNIAEIKSSIESWLHNYLLPTVVFCDLKNV